MPTKKIITLLLIALAATAMTLLPATETARASTPEHLGVLDHCDQLIGGHVSGEYSGTVVALTFEGTQPVVWIDRDQPGKVLVKAFLKDVIIDSLGSRVSTATLFSQGLVGRKVSSERVALITLEHDGLYAWLQVDRQNSAKRGIGQGLVLAH